MAKKKPSRGRFTGITTQAWIWIIVGASAWMFILGVIVGRGIVPKQFDIHKIKTELRALMAEAEETQKTQLAAAIEQLNDPDEMDIHKKLATPVSNKKTLDIPSNPRPPKSTGRPENSRRSENKGSPAPVEPPKKPQADKLKPVRPDQQDQPATGKHFAVQVASFKMAGDAARRVIELKRKGMDAYMTAVELKDVGVRYRVMVGRYKKVAAAKEMQRLLKSSKIDGFILMTESRNQGR